jgi:hypothetical protein
MPVCIPFIEASANTYFHSPRGGNAENNPAPPLIDTAHGPSFILPEYLQSRLQETFSTEHLH